LNSAKDSLSKASESFKQNLPDTSGISDGINSFRESTQSATSDFSSSGVMSAGKDFLNSNSLIARFVFVILVLIVFMFFLNIGLSLVTYFVSPSKSPYIIHGMLPASSSTPFPQDPASGTAVVYRSNNQASGTEFTWSMWLKVDSMPSDDAYHCVFVKGNDEYTSGTSTESSRYGLSTVNNGPGVYLYRDVSNNDSAGNKSSYGLTMLYMMDVVSPDGKQQTSAQNAVIPNLPVGKWFHVAIRLQNKVMDCYVNGVIVNRISFGDHIPKQNYDAIIFAGNGGYPGSISNLRYYDYALSVFEMNSVVYYGPNLSAANGSSSNYFDYLGKSWYSDNVPK
jgi:hypothetical protein